VLSMSSSETRWPDRSTVKATFPAPSGPRLERKSLLAGQTGGNLPLPFADSNCLRVTKVGCGRADHEAKIAKLQPSKKTCIYSSLGVAAERDSKAHCRHTKIPLPALDTIEKN